MPSMELKAIGTIHSAFQSGEDAPRQGAYTDELSRIEVFPDFASAPVGLEKYRHLIVLYWADRAARDVLQSRRHRAWGEERGIFASHSPVRPNPICYSVCEIVEMKGNLLKVRGLEALDGSPLLDLKPLVKELDCPAS